MTYCHVAVSTADTSQQDNFTDSHVSLKALFETTELGQRHFKSCTAMVLQQTRCCGFSASRTSLHREAAASPAIHQKHLRLTTDGR